MHLRELILCCALALSSCTASSEGLQPSAAGIDLSLAMVDGRPFELSALRGKPVLLFMFATYDTASQLSLARLESLLKRDPTPTVVGIALQPDAQRFLELYQQTLAVSFLLCYDPKDVILKGTTALGEVRAIPLLVALDEHGHERARHYGPATDAQLTELVDAIRP
jgi:peroxiredoxin